MDAADGAEQTRAKMIAGVAGRAMLRFGAVRRAHRYLEGRYSRDIPVAGVAASPRQRATESVGAAFLGAMPAVCVSVILYAVTGMPYAFLFLSAPAALFFMKGLGLRDMARKRAAGADSELFFFAIYCDIMEKTGRGLHGAFEALKGGGPMFPAMHRESLAIRREMRVFSRSFADVLHNLGTTHPSAAFRDFVRGYAVSQTTGGVGTAAYLHERLREYHTAARQRMDAYASTAEMLATVGSFGLAMFPIFVVVGGIMMDQYTLLFLCGFGILAVPAITTMLVSRAVAASPVPAGRIPVRRMPVAAAGAAGVACLVLGMSWWEITAVPLVVWCAANHCMSRGRLAGMSNLERSVPAFVRDVNQKMRSNPSFFAAFVSTEGMAPYTRQFNAVLRDIKSRVLLGVEISRALGDMRTGSWLADCVMMLMAQAARSGSVTPAVLDRLALFASHHVETKKEMSAKTATPLMTGYMGSVIVVMMIMMIPVMSFDQFAALDVLSGSAAPGAAAAPDASYMGYGLGGLLEELNLVLVVVGAFCSMILVSQIRYATILHSLHTGVLLAVITGMLYYDRLAGAAGVPALQF